jgi:hypothetical protein
MENPIPRDDAGFDLSQKRITNATDIYKEQWNIDNTWYAANIPPKRTAWEDAYQAYLDPGDRTIVKTVAKQEARKEYEREIRKLARMVEASPNVTPADLTYIGLTVPSTERTPAPVALTFPAAKVDTSTIKELKIYFHDQESEHKAKPKGQHGAEMWWMILETPPVSEKDLTNSTFDTNSPLTLSFYENDRGKTVYFCLRWENTRGEKGPWSGISSAIIP